MDRKLKLINLTRSIVLLILISGCDERATKIAREAADRQAEQNTTITELNKEVAGGAHRLVEADAQTRKAIVGVHHDLQAERTRLDVSWQTLEQERRQIAAERRTESILVPAIQVGGLMLLGVLLLGFCWYALVVSRNSDSTDVQLNEILVGTILSDDSPFVFSHSAPMLDQHSPVSQMVE